MDRNRNRNQEHRPEIIVKRKRGRPPMVKKEVDEEPEVIDVPDEENIWITYDDVEPDMVLLQPLMRIGQVMVNPTKAGSYHVRPAAAKKIVAKMGDGWGVEGNAIVRKLPYAFTCTLADDYTKQLRQYLLNMKADATQGILGIHVAQEGKLPDKRDKGWLYVTTPTRSTCANKAGLFLKDHLTPEQVANTRDVKRGIFDDSGALEFATYAEQLINVRMYVDGAQYTGKIIYTAIKNGAQFAMKYKAKDIPLDEFLKTELKILQNAKGEEVTKAKKAIETHEANVAGAVANLRKYQEQLDTAREDLARHDRKLTKNYLVKEYPALANIDRINDDDPAILVAYTKDVILNGVNLGPYKIKVNPAQAAITIGAKKAPKDLTHPKLYVVGGKWKWELDEKDLNRALGALAVGRMAEVLNIVVGSLVTMNEKDEAQIARLKQIEEYIKANEPKKEEVIAQ